MKYYDSSKKQLIYIRKRATSKYWDKYWKTENIRERIFNSGRHSFIARITRKYLHPSEGPILEGGCGLGFKVESLKLNGYKCIGIDNARKIVQILQDDIPELDIRYGDIRKLNFSDNYFTGYWSIGVIEHYWNGYDDIANEMLRVIRQGGYLFLLFPYMSYFRRLKFKIGIYPKFRNQSTHNFYQFALNAASVRLYFEELEFTLINTYYRGVMYGLKDEIKCASKFIDIILSHMDYNFLTKLLWSVFSNAVDYLLGSVFGHTILFVFQKK